MGKLELRTTLVDSIVIIRVPSADALTAAAKRCKGTASLHHYHAFGLRIASELELPELHAGSGPADVVIHFTETEHAESDAYGPTAVSGGVVQLLLDGIRFTLAHGKIIGISAPAAMPAADIRIWLLGTVMAGLLHQRSYLSIHANVAALDQTRAAAFAGDSGAGKSTLAAWLELRGHEVLADDLCAILIGAGGQPQVFEGIPRMKLWADTLNAFNRSADGLEKVASDLDKYHVPLGRARRTGSLEPLRLERLYLLARSDSGPAATITAVRGSDAARGVLANTFRWELGQMIQEPRAQFDQCLAVARSAAIFRVTRRWGMDAFDEAAETIERHLMTPLDELQA